MPRWAVVVSGHELGTEKFVPDGQQLLPDQLDERRRAAHVGLQVRREIQLPSPCTVAQLATDLSRLLDHPGVESTAMLGYSNGGAVAQ
jgi:pimeloyl-ACP methyl ester carboxylesterase